MRTAMTDEQRLFFEANGYLAIPGALEGEELDRVRAAAARAEDRWRADPSLPGTRSPNLDQVQCPIEYGTVLLELLEHPRVYPIVREILGDDVSMIDNDYVITPPGAQSHSAWHHDVGLRGVYHPRSVMMVKVFYLLSDVTVDGGGTAVLPGSHRFPMEFRLPQPEAPEAMPGHVRMAFPAGTAYLFNGRIYHAALSNRTQEPRRVLIYNYGHFWMKIWQGYEPSEEAKSRARTPVLRQLLGIGDAYGQALSE